ncbi:PadR family transcriptional regulator [Halomarina salina]|uniref:PadR family transcriptional regulator n=1 Tax=Halomarina salina TaxID=1872699 RepID=A0ABD5RHR0_9EURY
MHQLTGFQRDLLYCIAGLEKPSGQSIKEELEGRMDHEITHGRLYPNLDTLVETELVSKGDIDRRTNYYDISEKGVAALQEYHQWGGEQLP